MAEAGQEEVSPTFTQRVKQKVSGSYDYAKANPKTVIGGVVIAGVLIFLGRASCKSTTNTKTQEVDVKLADGTVIKSGGTDRSFTRPSLNPTGPTRGPQRKSMRHRQITRRRDVTDSNGNVMTVEEKLFVDENNNVVGADLEPVPANSLLTEGAESDTAVIASQSSAIGSALSSATNIVMTNVYGFFDGIKHVASDLAGNVEVGPTEPADLSSATATLEQQGLTLPQAVTVEVNNNPDDVLVVHDTTGSIEDVGTVVSSNDHDGVVDTLVDLTGDGVADVLVVNDGNPADNGQVDVVGSLDDNLHPLDELHDSVVGTTLSPTVPVDGATGRQRLTGWLPMNLPLSEGESVTADQRGFVLVLGTDHILRLWDVSDNKALVPDKVIWMTTLSKAPADIKSSYALLSNSGELMIYEGQVNADGSLTSTALLWKSANSAFVKPDAEEVPLFSLNIGDDGVLRIFSVDSNGSILQGPLAWQSSSMTTE